MAWVQVSDETWTAFRVAIGTAPVSVALGRLVEREVATPRRRSATDADAVRGAVEDARLGVDELTKLVRRFEARDGAASVVAGVQDQRDLSSAGRP